MDAGGYDVVVLDGEATPAGGSRPVPSAEERDLPLPADPRAHRPAAGRLAGRLVARRPRPCRTPSTRSPCPRPSPTWPARGSRSADRRVDTAAGPDHAGRTCSPRCCAATTSPPEQAALGHDRGHERRGDARCSSPGSSWPCAPRARRSRSCAASPTSCSSTRTGSRSRARRSTSSAPAGTGMHSVNISTMAAIVVAATGLRVVKHGNRCGVVELGLGRRARGARGLADADARRRWPRSPRRPASPSASPTPSTPRCATPPSTRRDLGVGTAFNALGPLTNPAQPTYAAVGVADARIAPIIAGVFAGRGRAASVFRGDDGLDELTLATTSTVWWVRDGAGHRS